MFLNKNNKTKTAILSNKTEFIFLNNKSKNFFLTIINWNHFFCKYKLNLFVLSKLEPLISIKIDFIT